MAFDLTQRAFENLRNPDEIECERQEFIGQIPTGWESGPLSVHEALDRSWLAVDFVASSLMEHPDIILDESAFELAWMAHENLFKLYQRMGERSSGGGTT